MSKNKIFTIAVDGESSSGKGTVSKIIAEKLNYAYLDTGLIYRAVAYLAAKHEVLNNAEAIIKIAKNLEPQSFEVKLLKSDSVAQIASQYVANKLEVREALLNYQRDFAKNPSKYVHKEVSGVILDGRDIATVILPQADIKFFITASLEVRANRRYQELKLSDKDITLNKIKDSLYLRDKSDKERTHSALKLAQDSIVIDTSKLTIEEVVTKALNYIAKIKDKK